MKPIFASLASTALFGLSASLASADSIAPTSFADTLNVGESVTIKKTVTVSAGPATSSKVDVFFLADETGSMGSQIAAVKAAAASILAGAASAGDVAFGVGGYKDVGDDFVYKLRSDITTSTVATQAGINAWVASGGGDLPEANLFALQSLSTGTSWRAGSERILVWFGDAIGHDPSVGATQASATAALIAAGVNVQALNVGNLNGSGQASAIATATGGTYYPSVNAATIVQVIKDAITTAVSTYSVVGLDLSEAPAGVSVTAAPGSYVGSWDRSVERTFEFDVTFTGVAPGDYSFPIYGTVDRGRVAKEDDRISVPDGRVPEGGASIVMLGIALSGLGLVRRAQRTA